jgi:DNA polymerase-2
MLDAMRLVRSGPNHFADLSFASVAQAMLGVDKAVLEVGTSIGRSCLNDAELCREILDVSGLLKLTIRRSILTGSFLDMAWTSIASFETLYARELRKKGIVEPHPSSMPLSGSPGGTIFEPTACLREAVLVFDYRSLYPSIISTFFIDPLGFRDAKEIPDELCVTAPNGARFVRGHGILPSFIAYCFAERIVAVDRGDKTGAYVLKILMNSLYGVLAADGCRYAHGDLAGAVTTFGTWCLETAREWFESRGLEVFYGDTDSIFLQSALTEANSHLEFSKLGEELAEEFNRYLSRSILERWQVESRIQLRFDKAYRRFLIPPTRMQNGIGKSVRGRSKGYAGLEARPQGEDVLDIKGMEAVRSDVTPLARRLQRELLTMVFTGRTAIIPEYLCDLKRDLLAGRLDNELVYHKKFRHRAQRPRRDMPTDDRATVRVASEKTGHRISYVWTVIGPYPVGSDCHKIDYRHYLASQILPIARGIGALAGFNPDDILCNGQMELFSPDRPDVSSS